MSVLIDPPLWPAHGTTFSHLVSDSSIEELHAFAAALGVSPRAFDRDHYDVPAHRHAEAVARGAEAVPAGELTRRLRASGLRVPARERPERIRKILLARWEAETGGTAEAGERLLARWEEGRHYHDTVHLLEVLDRIDLLDEGASRPEEENRALRLAAWYHDAVYTGASGQDEEDSARLCETEHPETAGHRAAELIRATADHAAEHPDPLWPLLHDADLGILAAERARYDRYAAAVRREYAAVPDADFARGRAAVLEGFLDRDRLYLTDTGHRRWDAAARENLSREIASLRRGARTSSSDGTAGSPRPGR